jgi:hypothetical protein
MAIRDPLNMISFTTHKLTKPIKGHREHKILTSPFTVMIISGSRRLTDFVLPAIGATHQQF